MALDIRGINGQKKRYKNPQNQQTNILCVKREHKFGENCHIISPSQP